MKNITRFILGLLASLFLTVGLVRAAEVITPHHLTAPAQSNAAGERSCMPTENCSPTFW